MVASSEIQKELRFTKGLNLLTPPTELDDNELARCENFLVGDNGELTKRSGFYKVITTIGAGGAGNGYAILGFLPTGDAIIVSDNNNTESYSVSFPGGAATAITSLPSSENPWWMLSIQGTTYMGFTVLPGVRVLTGTVVGANIANSPGSTIACFHKNRIFTNVTAPVSFPGRIMFSDPPAGGVIISGTFTWTTTNTIDIGVEDSGEPITGLVSLGDLLIIFKRNSVWSLYVQGTSPADWVVRKISNVYGGVVSRRHLPYSVYGNEVYFLSQKVGVVKTNGQSFQEISQNVWPYPQAIQANLGDINRVAIWRNYLFVLIKNFSLTVNPKGFLYAYNLRTQAWSTWTFLSSVPDDIAATKTAAILQTLGVSLYWADYSSDQYWYPTILGLGFNSFADGFVYNSAGTGTPYNALFQTKDFSMAADRLLRNKWTGAEYLSYSSPTFSYVIDAVDQIGLGITATPGFNSASKSGYRFFGAGRCRTFSLIGQHGLASPWELNRVSLHIAGKYAQVRAKHL